MRIVSHINVTVVVVRPSLASRLRLTVRVVRGALVGADRVLGRAARVARLARLHCARAAAALPFTPTPCLQSLPKLYIFHIHTNRICPETC